MNIEAVASWLVSTGFDVSVLILLILLVRRPFARFFGARAAYSLWSLPLIRIALPEIPITIKSPVLAEYVPNLAPDVFFTDSAAILSGGMVETQPSWQLLAVVIWLSVATIWLTYQVRRQSILTRTLKQKLEPVSPYVQTKVENTAAVLNMKNVPGVKISENNIGPLVTGLIEPIIILPQSFESNFSDEQQELALLHEFAHVKRRDLWAAAAMVLFKAMNWPNPLVHFASRKFRSDQEAACDATVLGSINSGSQTIKTYAETLLHSANLNRNSTREDLGVAPLSLTIYHPLKERLMTIKTHKQNTTILSRIGVGAFLIAALTATAPITIATAQEADPNIEVKSKKVLKMVEQNDGVREEKHYEITEENGVTTAYSIDQHGNRTVVDLSEIENIDGMSGLNINVMGGEHEGGKRIKIIGTEGLQGAHEKVFVRRMKDGEDGELNVEVFSSGDAHGYAYGSGDHASAMVRAAQNLIERAGEDNPDISSNAQHKLEKARKALKEAQEALDNE